MRTERKEKTKEKKQKREKYLETKENIHTHVAYFHISSFLVYLHISIQSHFEIVSINMICQLIVFFFFFVCIRNKKRKKNLMNKRKKTNEQNAQTKCLGRKKNKGISTEKKTKK